MAQLSPAGSLLVITTKNSTLFQVTRPASISTFYCNLQHVQDVYGSSFYAVRTSFILLMLPVDGICVSHTLAPIRELVSLLVLLMEKG